MTPIRSSLLVLASTCALIGCTEPATSPIASVPSYTISDGAHGGNPHFYFLNPMVPAPNPSGVFDASVHPRVEICQWINGACGATQFEFTTDVGADSETIRVSGEFYIVNWHAGNYNLDPAVTYRIRVLAGEQELGFADVDVVATGKELKNVATNEMIPLLNGRTLPIKFRIENGAVTPIGIGDVAVGFLTACAVNVYGAAFCWGSGNEGQLGSGNLSSSNVPVAVIGGVTFKSVSTISHHVCGVSTAGDAYCWGADYLGQLGDGGPPDTPNSTLSPTPVLVVGGYKFDQVFAGYNHTCGLTTSGQALCWGANSNGQLGTGTSNYSSPAPVPVAGGYTFKSINVGFFSTCGITTAGAALCWGYNYYGMLGNGSTGNYLLSPTPVSGNHTFKSIDVGGNYQTCGITDTDAAFCWGSNAYGALGTGGVGGINPTPVAVTGGHSFKAISAGEQHTCAVTTTNEGFCWGDNFYGQLGTGNFSPSAIPVSIGAFEFLQAGQVFTCGKSSNNDLKCWGYNGQGNLGIGASGPSIPSPAFVFSLAP